MSTIQIQRKKQLTFENICPQWSVAVPEYLTKMWFVNHSYLDISNSKYCIVGEAHGFNTDYTDSTSTQYCKTCSKFSDAFCYIEGLQENKEAFVQHWNTKHI